MSDTITAPVTIEPNEITAPVTLAPNVINAPVILTGGAPLAVEDEGVETVPVATRMNFVGAGVSVAEDPGGTAKVTIPGGGGGGGDGHVIQDEGVDLTARTNLNFIGDGVTAADDAGNDATTVTIDQGWQNDFADVTDPAYAGGADPTNTSDSTAAMQAALDSGKKVWIPNGQYKLTAQLSMHIRGQIVQGQSYTQTILDWSGAPTPADTGWYLAGHDGSEVTNGPGSSAGSNNFASIRDCWNIGPGKAATGSIGFVNLPNPGAGGWSGEGFEFYRVHFQSWETGIHYLEGNKPYWHDLHLKDCATGMKLDKDDSATSNCMLIGPLHLNGCTTGILGTGARFRIRVGDTTATPIVADLTGCFGSFLGGELEGYAAGAFDVKGNSSIRFEDCRFLGGQTITPIHVTSSVVEVVNIQLAQSGITVPFAQMQDAAATIHGYSDAPNYSSSSPVSQKAMVELADGTEVHLNPFPQRTDAPAIIAATARGHIYNSFRGSTHDIGDSIQTTIMTPDNAPVRAFLTHNNYYVGTTSAAPHQLTGKYDVHMVEGTATGTQAVTLPADTAYYAYSLSAYRYIIIDADGNAGTNNITLTCAGGDTFQDGSSTYVINQDNGYVGIQSIRDNVWYIWTESKGGGGEVNTSSNDGGGIELAKAKNLQDLPFKTLDSGDFTEAADLVSIGDLTDKLSVESVRNQSGGTLFKGEAVYVSGYDGVNSLPLVTGADSSSASTMPAIGLVAADITSNTNGTVVVHGNLSGINTSSFSEGDILYVESSSPGAITNVKPNSLAQVVGVVTRSHASLGEVFVEVSSLTNATWGDITGTLSQQTDLQSALDGKADSSHTHAAADVTSGTFADARVAESNVTQHQAALSITQSQISDLDHTDADAIHDNVAGEIAALGLVTAASGDHLIIEDASDSNNKKRVAASDFLAGSGDMILASTQTSTGKKTFDADATNPGINVGSHTADPSTTVNGDLWYNSTTNKLRTKQNGTDTDVIGAGGGGGGPQPVRFHIHNAAGISSGDFDVCQYSPGNTVDAWRIEARDANFNLIETTMTTTIKTKAWTSPYTDGGGTSIEGTGDLPSLTTATSNADDGTPGLNAFTTGHLVEVAAGSTDLNVKHLIITLVISEA